MITKNLEFFQPNRNAVLVGQGGLEQKKVGKLRLSFKTPQMPRKTPKTICNQWYGFDVKMGEAATNSNGVGKYVFVQMQ